MYLRLVDHSFQNRGTISIRLDFSSHRTVRKTLTLSLIHIVMACSHSISLSTFTRGAHTPAPPHAPAADRAAPLLRDTHPRNIQTSL